MKKVLITGNSGYIGSHLSKMLCTDYELYGLDINPSQFPVTEHFQVDINKVFNMDISAAFKHAVSLVIIDGLCLGIDVSGDK